MATTIGAWERKAKICLVDVSIDKEIFTNVLNSLLNENKSDETIYNITFPQIELAHQNLSSTANEKFICMFVWGYDKQRYLPFCSELFSDEDTESIQKIVTQFIQLSIQCCSDGFELVTFNEQNKLLAFALQALCENQIMQSNLKA